VNVYTNGLAYGIDLAPLAGTVVYGIEAFNLYLDGFGANAVHGFLFSPGGGTISAIKFHAGAAAGFGVNGVLFLQTATGSVIDVVFDSVYIVGNGNDGIQFPTSSLNVKNVTFQNCLVEANSNASSGTRFGASVQNGTNITFQGGVYAAGSYNNGVNSQGYGIAVGGGTNNVRVLNAVLAPNVAGPIFIAGSNPGLVVKDCAGYNPVGIVAITVGASPYTYTAGSSPETVYVQGGTISEISRGAPGGTLIANTAPPAGQSVIIPLAPNMQISVTYTVAPTMFRDVQ
jgi:hypothetical protein